jgi:hypothetical protein
MKGDEDIDEEDCKNKNHESKYRCFLYGVCDESHSDNVSHYAVEKASCVRIPASFVVVSCL